MIMRFLKLLFCFPMMLMLGIPAPGGPDDDNSNDGREDGAKSAGNGDDNRNNEEESGDDVDEETVSMTKSELKKLIDETFSKGSRKGKREARREQKAAEDKGDDGTSTIEDETSKKVSALIQKANERMLSGTVKSIASDIGITAKGAKAALKLADFSDCIKGDDVDEKSVGDVLEDFLKEYPEFAVKKEENPDTKSWGIRHGKTKPISGIEEAFYARNPDLKE